MRKKDKGEGWFSAYVIRPSVYWQYAYLSREGRSIRKFQKVMAK